MTEEKRIEWIAGKRRGMPRGPGAYTPEYEETLRWPLQ